MPNFDRKHLRRKILKMAYDGQTAHVGCALSIIDIVAEIYENYVQNGKGLFVLSKGHGVMAVFVCLHELGLLTDQDLDNYGKDGSLLHGLAESHISGIHATAGSLGHGLPIAVGMAYGMKLNKDLRKIFCLVGDGELQAGSNWEALQFAGHHQLDNLEVIVDDNGFQAMGQTESILTGSVHPLTFKKTIKGHGISFMEDNNDFHYKRLTKDEYEKAMEELT